MTVEDLMDILEDFNDQLEICIQVYDWDREHDGPVVPLDFPEIVANDGKVIIHL